jgi:hypothetical protein
MFNQRSAGVRMGLSKFFRVGAPSPVADADLDNG